MTLSRLPSRCKFCRVKFSPEERVRGWKVHPDCIGPYAESAASRLERKRVAKAKQLKAADARETRAKKTALKTIPDLIKEAQREFNSFIRARDRAAGHPCVSSRRPLDWTGNGVDAGHYRSVGAAPHLRFDERNVHAQSKHDNQWKSGNVVDYRINLIQRIGLEAVEALESDNRVHRWTREELIEIRETYKGKRKQLENKE